MATQEDPSWVDEWVSDSSDSGGGNNTKGPLNMEEWHSSDSQDKKHNKQHSTQKEKQQKASQSSDPSFELTLESPQWVSPLKDNANFSQTESFSLVLPSPPVVSPLGEKSILEEVLVPPAPACDKRRSRSLGPRRKRSSSSEGRRLSSSHHKRSSSHHGRRNRNRHTVRGETSTKQLDKTKEERSDQESRKVGRGRTALSRNSDHRRSRSSGRPRRHRNPVEDPVDHERPVSSSSLHNAPQTSIRSYPESARKEDLRPTSARSHPEPARREDFHQAKISRTHSGDRRRSKSTGRPRRRQSISLSEHKKPLSNRSFHDEQPASSRSNPDRLKSGEFHRAAPSRSYSSGDRRSARSLGRRRSNDNEKPSSTRSRELLQRKNFESRKAVSVDEIHRFIEHPEGLQKRRSRSKDRRTAGKERRSSSRGRRKVLEDDASDRRRRRGTKQILEQKQLPEINAGNQKFNPAYNLLPRTMSETPQDG